MKRRNFLSKNNPLAIRKFMLFWLDGSVETVSGVDLCDAFTCAGYGPKKITKLDYSREVKR